MSLSFSITGALKPAPISFFQSSFGLRRSVAEKRSAVVPFLYGPRNWGQSDALVPIAKASAKSVTRPVIIVEPILPYDRANAYRGCT